MIVLVPVLAVGAIVWFVVQMRRKHAEVRVDTWVGDQDTAALAVRRGTASAVAVALGRVEARKIAMSVSFAVGIAFSALALFAMGTFDTFDNGDLWGRVVQHLGLVAYPLAGMTLIAANRATLRSRREGTEELFTAAPTTRTTRTAGHLLSVDAGALAAVLLVAAVLFISPFRERTGPLGPQWVAEVLAAVAFVVGAGALGVLLARWLPHGIVAPIALVGILFGTLGFNGVRPFTNPTRYWAPWASPPPDLAPEFVLRPAWPHLLYLAGLIVLVVAVALLRTSHGNVVVATVTVGAVVAASGAWFQSRPVSTRDAARVASQINHPGAHQVCRVRSGIHACAYTEYRDSIAAWTAPAARVRAQLPATVRERRYEIVQRVSASGLRNLDAAVTNRLGASIPRAPYYAWRDDGIEHPGFGGDTSRWAYALWPAQSAVGLPMTTSVGRGLPCYAGGQARSIVALWLAAQAVDRGLGRSMLEPPAKIDAAGESWYSNRSPWALTRWAATWDTDVAAPVAFARPDIAAARELLDRPSAEVRAALHANWELLTDPATRTTVLVDTLGLRRVANAQARTVPPGLKPCP